MVLQLIGKEARDKILQLSKIKVDTANWYIYYTNIEGEKWKEDRPNSDHQVEGSID